ncbi:hypothetical protein AB1N83_007640 [Pleurotus pulmonarius]
MDLCFDDLGRHHRIISLVWRASYISPRLNCSNSVPNTFSQSVENAPKMVKGVPDVALGPSRTRVYVAGSTLAIPKKF